MEPNRVKIHGENKKIRSVHHDRIVMYSKYNHLNRGRTLHLEDARIFISNLFGRELYRRTRRLAFERSLTLHTNTNNAQLNSTPLAPLALTLSRARYPFDHFSKRLACCLLQCERDPFPATAPRIDRLKTSGSHLRHPCLALDASTARSTIRVAARDGGAHPAPCSRLYVLSVQNVTE